MSPIVNLQLVVKCKKRSFHSFRVEVALLRYIVFYCKLGCDTSEPHVSCISRACSSLVRQSYYIPDRFILKISGLESILASEKGRWDGRIFYIDEYALILLFSRCARCAQKRYCWESVRFASERSRDSNSTALPQAGQAIRPVQRRRPQPVAETGRSCWGHVLIFQSPAKGLRKNQLTQLVAVA